jgi:mRNA-degrading endonuclease RelE of RelBE toxin-antitoxin system
LAGRILYKSSVGCDLKEMRQEDVERILWQIRNESGKNPNAGKPLHGEFEGLLKFRVGDYGIIYAFSGQDFLVLRIRHRGKAYN